MTEAGKGQRRFFLYEKGRNIFAVMLIYICIAMSAGRIRYVLLIHCFPRPGAGHRRVFAHLELRSSLSVPKLPGTEVCRGDQSLPGCTASFGHVDLHLHLLPPGCGGHDHRVLPGLQGAGPSESRGEGTPGDIGTLPLFVILPLKKFVDNLYGNTWAIAIALLVTGCLLFVSDRLARGRKTIRTVSLVDIIIIGFAQGLATIPGLSRSGTTISVAMMRGCRRDFAVRYSFLLSIPAVIGANILTLVDAFQVGIDWSLMPAYLLGVAISAVSGYFAIGLVNMLSNKGKFGNFAYYCWGVGVLAMILILVLK